MQDYDIQQGTWKYKYQLQFEYNICFFYSNIHNHVNSKYKLIHSSMQNYIFFTYILCFLFVYSSSYIIIIHYKFEYHNF